MTTTLRQEGGQRIHGRAKGDTSAQPRITVVTVVFNNAVLLEKTIQSVLNQTYPDVEYIIIDGGSTDGTIDIIKKYEDRIGYWVSEKDQGLYDAINKGIALASGEWIHILNSDDRYVDNFVLEKVVPSLKDSVGSFYYGALLFDDLSGQYTLQKFQYIRWKYPCLFYSAYIPHPTLLVSRTCYQAVGLYDTQFRIAADHDIILRLLHIARAVFVPVPMTVMRTGGVSSVNQYKTFLDFKQVTIKHGLPRWIANFVFFVKIVKYRLFRGTLSTIQKS